MLRFTLFVLVLIWTDVPIWSSDYTGLNARKPFITLVWFVLKREQQWEQQNYRLFFFRVENKRVGIY